MKAYQLKIAIKIRSPGMETVPGTGGDYLSQLAPILEVVTETAENAWYEFEFFQKKVQIREWQGDASAVARPRSNIRMLLKPALIL